MADASTPPAAAPKKKSNVLMIVLLLLGLFIGLPCIGCIGCIVWGVSNVEPLMIGGMVTVQASFSPQLSERLGDPIEADGLPKVTINGSSATADGTFKGPNGSAKVHAELSKSGEAWEISSMTATFDDGTTVDLMSDDFMMDDDFGSDDSAPDDGGDGSPDEGSPDEG